MSPHDATAAPLVRHLLAEHYGCDSLRQIP